MNPVMQICRMDVNIRHWNEINNTVESWYIDSQFLQRPNARVLLEKIKAASKESPEGRLLQLWIDWPSVKGAEATYVEIATEIKKSTLDWKTYSISMFSEFFSPYKHVLAALFRK